MYFCIIFIEFLYIKKKKCSCAHPIIITEHTIQTNIHTLMFHHLQLKSFEFLHFFLTNPPIILTFHLFSTLHSTTATKDNFFSSIFILKRCHWAHLNHSANKSIFKKIPKKCVLRTRKIESPIRFTKKRNRTLKTKNSHTICVLFLCLWMGVWAHQYYDNSKRHLKNTRTYTHFVFINSVRTWSKTSYFLWILSLFWTEVLYTYTQTENGQPATFIHQSNKK